MRYLGCLVTKRDPLVYANEVTLSHAFWRCTRVLVRPTPRRSNEEKMPGNKKKNKGGNKGAKSAPARSNAANKDDLAGLDEILR